MRPFDRKHFVNVCKYVWGEIDEPYLFNRPRGAACLVPRRLFFAHRLLRLLVVSRKELLVRVTGLSVLLVSNSICTAISIPK